MPSYLEQFDPTISLHDNALVTILRSNTYLSEEPDWLLLEDLRREVVYGSILRAVAQGERKPSDIAKAIGKDSAQDITQQLTTLQELGLLLREVPVTEKQQARSRNSLYFLADHYLAFWYRFIDPARSLVTQGLGRQVWDRLIAPGFQEYISRPVFEWSCRQYLWRALRHNVLPNNLLITDVGTWWGAGDVEIDVVALNEAGAVTLAGSCKWTNEPMGMREYAALQQAVATAGWVEGAPYLYLFSRAGFSERLRQLAEQQESQRLHLIEVAELYAV
jgi:hypothetical protein